MFRRSNSFLTAIILSVALGAIAAVAPATAYWSGDPGTNVPVCTWMGDQMYPVMASDGAGGAILVWQDHRGVDYNVYAEHLKVNGELDATWPSGGVAVCTAVGDQFPQAVISDGLGGALVVWQDWRADNGHIYAHHVLSNGTLDPAWPVDGQALCTASGMQGFSSLAWDGSGGAFVVWRDYRATVSHVYATHVLLNGTVDPAWPKDGAAVSTGPGYQVALVVIYDGYAGAIAAWTSIQGSVGDIYAQHLLSGGVDVSWHANGVAVCTATGDQNLARVVADGSGGAVLTWKDARSGDNDIYAMHLAGNGVVDPNWPANGLAVCVQSGDQTYPKLVSDGSGGALIAWHDKRSGSSYDIYAQHVLSSGSVDSAWTANGVPVCTADYDQQYPDVITDGAGGMICTWRDFRAGSGGNDIYAQHVRSGGVVDSLWTVNGVAVCTAAGAQDVMAVLPDGSGGMLAAWQDFRNGSNYDIYAQRVDWMGYLGAEPQITSVQDVAGDQGGAVRVSWLASSRDALPALEIGAYGIWRQISNDKAQRSLERGARVAGPGAGPEAARPGTLRATRQGAQTSWWEGVGTVLARGYSSYTFVAPTLADSTGASSADFAYMVDAHLAFRPGFFDSPPTYGHSVDNLAPSTPASFSGHRSGSSTALHWLPNIERDFQSYRLYRGTSGDFVPGPGTLLVEKGDTGFVDAGASPDSYYKLAAVDVHGNGSGYASISPQQVDGVSGPEPASLWLGRAVPNPARGGLTQIAFRLPRAGAATLSLFNTSGRRVKVLMRGVLSAGDHAASWDGTDERGAALPGGIYLYRLETPERLLSGKVVTLR